MAQWVAVYNATQNRPVVARARRCSSFVCQLRGLTFRRSLPPEEGLWLVGRRESRVETAIHMLFVFFPIAAIWLDSEGRVVDACLARPFRLAYAAGRPARDVLEGRPALLERVARGDQLTFEAVTV